MTTELLSTSIKGEGTPVIILHGLFGSSDNLSRVAIELEKSFKVIRIDLRNHGNSFHHQRMSYTAMAEDVLHVMDHYRIEKAHFIGHSMGGKVAMEFSLSYSDRVLKLIVADIAPVTYPPQHQKILEGLTSMPMEEISNRKQADEYLAKYIEEPGVRQFLLKGLDLSNNQKTAWKFNLSAILENYVSILSGDDTSRSFDGKTLFVAGGNSNYIQPEYKKKTMELFPQAQLKIIPDAGHWLHAEKPKVFISICQRFLEEQ